jgi:sugar (pentulose or hexulose) kinase
MAAQVLPGAEDLLFIPYLSGEQCPVWDPHTTGSFLGLTLRHTRAHLVRAVYEGIARSIARVLQSIEHTIEPIKEVRVTGGLINSATWLQLASDMFGTRIYVPETQEGSALGAAVFTSVRLAVDASMDSFTRTFDLLSGQADSTVVRSGGRVPEDLVARLWSHAVVEAASPLLSSSASPQWQPKNIIGFAET